MREGAKGGILKVILMGFMVMAVGGLVLMDVGGFFRGGVSSNVVAKGGGLSISTVEFDKAVRRSLGRQGIGPQEAYRMGYIHSILNNEIQMRLLTREAARLGLRASDELVRKQVEKLAEPLAREGQSKKDALKQILRNQGISESEFIGSIRQEIGNAALRNALVSGVSLTPDILAQDLYAAKNQTRSIETLMFKTSSVEAIEKPSEENLQKYYAANKTDYAIPETRRVTAATLKKEMLQGRVDISEDDLRNAYAENIELYTKPPRRNLEQAIVASPKEAEDIAAKAKEGKSLKDAALAVTGKTDAYLGAQDFQENGLPEDLAAAVFQAEAGDIVGPVQSPLGWHVMVLAKILDPEVTPFEQVKADIKEELLQTALLDELLETANMIDDRLASGEALEPIVQEFGLTTEKLPPFSQNGLSPEGKDVFKNYGAGKGEIIETIFSYDSGETTPVLETEGGQFVVFRIDESTPLDFKSFESVKAELKEKWIAAQKDLVAKVRAKEALEKLDGGASMEEVQKEFGGRLSSYRNLKRDADAPKALGPVVLSRVFSQEKGESFLAETGDGILLAKITDISFPDSGAEKESDLAAIKTSEKRANAIETLERYVYHMSANTEIRINERIISQLYGENGAN